MTRYGWKNIELSSIAFLKTDCSIDGFLGILQDFTTLFFRINLSLCFKCFFAHMYSSRLGNFLKFRSVILMETEISKQTKSTTNPAGNYMFKVAYRNTRTRCETSLKVTIKLPERRPDLALVYFE